MLYVTDNHLFTYLRSLCQFLQIEHQFCRKTCCSQLLGLELMWQDLLQMIDNVENSWCEVNSSWGGTNNIPILMVMEEGFGENSVFEWEKWETI